MKKVVIIFLLSNSLTLSSYSYLPQLEQKRNEKNKRMNAMRKRFESQNAPGPEERKVIKEFLIGFCKIKGQDTINYYLKRYRKNKARKLNQKSIEKWCDCVAEAHLKFKVHPPLEDLVPENYNLIHENLSEYTYWIGSEINEDFALQRSTCLAKLTVRGSNHQNFNKPRKIK